MGPSRRRRFARTPAMDGPASSPRSPPRMHVRRTSLIASTLVGAGLLAAGAPADHGTGVVADGTGWEMVSFDVDVTVRADGLRFDQTGTMVLRARTGANAGPVLTLAHAAVGFVDVTGPDGARVMVNDGR